MKSSTNEILYDNLIAAVRSKLPAVYKYLEVRRKKMKLRDIHHYDTYVPILSELDTSHTWKQAVDVVVKSLEPMGGDYCRVLHEGLAGRWCDRYPNQGKRSGAFSSGSYDGLPYILELPARRFGPRLHTGPRSRPLMHSHYWPSTSRTSTTTIQSLSPRCQHVQRTTAQPPPHEPAKTKKDRAYLVNREIDAIRGTIIRQTCSLIRKSRTLRRSRRTAHVETKPNTVTANRLLRPRFRHRRRLKLECLRIPHFIMRSTLQIRHRSSAAIALSERRQR
jgi:oligoendopeptidase F